MCCSIRTIEASEATAEANAKTAAVWLSSLDLSLLYQDRAYPHANQSVVATPIRIAGKKFAHGIGTYAKSAISIALDGNAKRLTAQVGIDDTMIGKGVANFEVRDENGKTLWSSGPDP